MLRVAVPNKGSLAEAASAMLREAGYRQRHDSKELMVPDPDNNAEFFFLRPRDIAVYVGSGTLDLGITGLDLLIDSGAPAEEVVPLGFGSSTFRFAALPGGPATVADLRQVLNVLAPRTMTGAGLPGSEQSGLRTLPTAGAVAADTAELTYFTPAFGAMRHCSRTCAPGRWAADARVAAPTPAATAAAWR